MGGVALKQNVLAAYKKMVEGEDIVTCLLKLDIFQEP